MVRIWILRPRPLSLEWAASLEAVGYRVFISPVLEIRPLPLQGFDPKTFDLALFTSQHGVTHFWDQVDASVSMFRAVYAVGPQTARALNRQGVRVDAVAPTHHGQGVVEAFGNAWTGQRVCFPTGTRTPDTLETQLRALGVHVSRFDVYETRLTPFSFPPLGIEDVILFSSPSCVEGFCLTVPHRGPFKAVAIGGTTQKHLEAKGFCHIAVCPKVGIEGVMAYLTNKQETFYPLEST